MTGVQVSVVAPLANQSGAGGKTTDGPLSASSQHTLSGYPATAVDGYPADSIIYAIRDMHLNPDLVVSGLNAGQNIGPAVNASGDMASRRSCWGLSDTNSLPRWAMSSTDCGRL